MPRKPDSGDVAIAGAVLGGIATYILTRDRGTAAVGAAVGAFTLGPTAERALSDVEPDPLARAIDEQIHSDTTVDLEEYR